MRAYEITLEGFGSYVSDSPAGVRSEISEDIRENPTYYKNENINMDEFENRVGFSEIGAEVKFGRYTIKVIDILDAKFLALPEFAGW